MGQDFHGKFAPYLLSFLISALAAVVPITFGGAGAREVFFKSFRRISYECRACGFLQRIVLFNLACVALSGLYYVLRPSRLEEGLKPFEEKQAGRINKSTLGKLIH